MNQITSFKCKSTRFICWMDWIEFNLLFIIHCIHSKETSCPHFVTRRTKHKRADNCSFCFKVSKIWLSHPCDIWSGSPRTLLSVWDCTFCVDLYCCFQFVWSKEQTVSFLKSLLFYSEIVSWCCLNYSKYSACGTGFCHLYVYVYLIQIATIFHVTSRGNEHGSQFQCMHNAKWQIESEEKNDLFTSITLVCLAVFCEVSAAYQKSKRVRERYTHIYHIRSKVKRKRCADETQLRVYVNKWALRSECVYASSCFLFLSNACIQFQCIEYM